MERSILMKGLCFQGQENMKHLLFHSSSSRKMWESLVQGFEVAWTLILLGKKTKF